MNQKVCDKCGEIITKENNALFECFEGSLCISGFDLCEKHWHELQEVIKKFGGRR